MVASTFVPSIENDNKIKNEKDETNNKISRVSNKYDAFDYRIIVPCGFGGSQQLPCLQSFDRK